MKTSRWFLWGLVAFIAAVGTAYFGLRSPKNPNDILYFSNMVPVELPGQLAKMGWFLLATGILFLLAGLLWLGGILRWVFFPFRWKRLTVTGIVAAAIYFAVFHVSSPAEVPQCTVPLDIPANDVGFTNAENGLALLADFFGPDAILRENPDAPTEAAFLQALGLTKKNAYPELPNVYRVYYDAWDKAMEADPDETPYAFLGEHPRPWRAEELPELAVAIEKASPLYDVLEKASEKKWFAYPELPPGKNVACLAVRWPIWGLYARVTLHAGEGNWDGAVRDCLTLWQLGQRVTNGRLGLDVPVGKAIFANAYQLSKILLADPNLPPEARKTLLDGVRNLPPLAEESRHTQNLAILYHQEIGNFPRRPTQILARCDFQTGPYVPWNAVIFALLPVDVPRMDREMTRWQNALETLSEEELRQESARYADELVAYHNLPFTLLAGRRSEMLGRNWGIQYVNASLFLRQNLREMREWREEILKK